VPQIFINLTPVTHVKPDISLLGDADSIVTYLSDRLGWDLPVPSEAKPVKIPLEDAKWLHGDGDWSHLHMLRSKSAPEDEDEDEDEERGEEGGEEGEGVKDEDGESGNEVDGPAEGDNGDTPSSHASRSTTASARSDAEVERKATHLHITSTPDHRASGSPASDRPAKRSRVGSPANE
jgi:hypothetical protein